MPKKEINQWDVKYLRTQPFMPFGSICNLIGQVYQGREISEKKLKELLELAFRLSVEFTNKAFKNAEDFGELKQNDLDFPQQT